MTTVTITEAPLAIADLLAKAGCAGGAGRLDTRQDHGRRAMVD
jgi:hypothetical protein